MPDDPQLDSLKLPPHSLEAEQSVLGGLLLDNDAVDKVGDVLADADFYSEAHRLIYAHILKLAAEAKPADVVTVSQSLTSVHCISGLIGKQRNGPIRQSGSRVPRRVHALRESCVVRSTLTRLPAPTGRMLSGGYQ